MEIKDYFVIERDRLIIGCTALHISPDNCAVLACLAVHADYRGVTRGQRLYENVLARAKKQAIQTLFVLSTQTVQWFAERGFEPCELHDVPVAIKSLYNPQRNSKILLKHL
jgi:amino-acid N-acetyltransferase